MSNRTFNRCIFAVFCTVIIIIPFAAGYFNVTSLNATAMECIQVISGLGALVIAVLTFRLVLAQLTKADAQLLKANVQIKLAHKQLDLANAQLDLARKDSAILTLQMRANAWAGIETDLLILDDIATIINSPKFTRLISLLSEHQSILHYPGIQDELHLIKTELIRSLDALRIRLVENFEKTAGHLTDPMNECRAALCLDLWELKVSLEQNSASSIEGQRSAVRKNIVHYFTQLDPLKSKSETLLKSARARHDIN